ncbi:hypothetical protein LY76DRAFT_349336 [Colletotrichum caudatum]|nr:hypothetical protein LY76DRAFT_349336 [Colletotrichum caudatum]
MNRDEWSCTQHGLTQSETPSGVRKESAAEAVLATRYATALPRSNFGLARPFRRRIMSNHPLWKGCHWQHTDTYVSIAWVGSPLPQTTVHTAPGRPLVKPTLASCLGSHTHSIFYTDSFNDCSSHQYPRRDTCVSIFRCVRKLDGLLDKP